MSQNLGSNLMARHFVISADGGSRGNPGPAAYGAVLSENNKILFELYETIGIATNNVAEYNGLLAALRKVNELDPMATVEAKMDSKLVVEQMSGRWQIKHPDMRLLAKHAREAHPQNLVTYKWIPRDENSHADRLANKALDGDVSTPNAPMQLNFLSERLVSNEKPTMIYFIRHGETHLTPERRFSGSDGSNPPLSESGLKQAEAVAKELAIRKADLLISSPMQRTTQTAQAISKATGLPITFDKQWLECGFGEWDELSVQEIQELYPSEWEQWVSNVSYRPGKTGESYVELAARIELALTDLAVEHPGKTIIVVAHNIVIKALTSLATGAPIETLFHVDAAPCSITSISIWPSDGLRALRSLNERGHLMHLHK
ncbi:MAG: histidine phosphatase family protein [Actinobacteria bacterium]|nr:histidine phosphatase family protein [Actinomycetota bacterium]